MPNRTQKRWKHVRANEQMRKVRKQIKRNRKTKRARSRDWRDLCDYDISGGFDELDFCDLDYPESERVMPRGERERRQSIVTTALAALQEKEEETYCYAEVQPYLDLGYTVLFTSALTGKGVDELRNVLRERTTVLAGMSGVGKSSLLNVVQPGLQLRTKEVSDHSHTGRHTTTQISLLKLESGSYVVDTPGIREFGLSGLRRGNLIRFYPEIAAVEGRCRFSDCSHSHEPGCAVRTAVQQGQLSEMRYHSYQQIYNTLLETQAQEQAQTHTRAWRR